MMVFESALCQSRSIYSSILGCQFVMNQAEVCCALFFFLHSAFLISTEVLVKTGSAGFICDSEQS